MPFVKVVVTVPAEGLPYMTVPICWPVAGTVEVKAAELPGIQVVKVAVPSATTYSTVPGDPFCPCASVVVYAMFPLVSVLVTVAAEGEP